MESKFGRSYRLSVETRSGSMLVIEPPFTLELDVVRNILSSANEAQIRVYNLSQVNRDQIRKDAWAFDDLRKVELSAGYGRNLPVVFRGNMSQAWSVREGTNFITTIKGYDAGFAFTNGVTNQSFPKDTPQTTILESLMGALPGVTVGTVGSYPGSISRGNTYSGNTTDILREISGGGFFVDNGTAHCLGDTECLEGDLKLIDASSGLLGTPIREQTYLNFDILFEPRLVIAQEIELRSGTAANFNGFYKVLSLKHRAMISEAVAGDAVTSVGLFAPQLLTTVK